jgi:hypothetical protein
MTNKKKCKRVIPNLIKVLAMLMLVGTFGGCAEKKLSEPSVAAVSTPTASSAPISKDEKTMAVVTREGELDLVDLKAEGSITKLDEGAMFSSPIISPEKQYVAYLKNNQLYFSNIKGEKFKIADDVQEDSYTWINKNNLLYSPQAGGMYIFDVDKKISRPYVSDEYFYKNITIGAEDKIYAERYKNYDNNGTKSRKDYGVVLFQQEGKNQQLIIKSIPMDDNTLGMYPSILGISSDFSFLYIWEHSHAGSLSTDGMNLASYDTKNNKYMQYADLGLVLGYKDNISGCTKNNEQLAVINGEGRQMNSDKNLSILNLSTGSFEKLLPENQVAMTPYYSSDCKSILYAASEKLGEMESTGKWVKIKHPIYSINTATKQTTQLTNSQDGFDFSPTYINDKDIVFFRSTPEGNVGLWKLQNGKEVKLIDNLAFYNDEYKNQNFYGHFNNAKYTDIK